MRRRLAILVLTAAAVVGLAVLDVSVTARQGRTPWVGVLDEHPTIEYAKRPTSDRITKLTQALAQNSVSLQKDAQTGYLRSLLDALDLSIDSQLLVFSKTGVQGAFTGPHSPRALYFDESVVVGYIRGAPMIELAAHDPQQGVVFYVLPQVSNPPRLIRQTSCLSCHVSASTLDVPGIITRSNAVDIDGAPIPQLGSNEVTHLTSHTDRWGGWFVTSEGAPPPYPTRAHEGNITFTKEGHTSNQVFVEWLDSAPETRGYLSASSDIVGLLAFDHQMHAINLITRLNWEARLAVADGRDEGSDPTIRGFVNELADYLLFVGEVPPNATLVPRVDFAKRLESKTPKDHLGRSFGQLDLVRRLLRYPCSYMIYTDAFNGLPKSVKDAVYQRMIDILSGTDTHRQYARLSADDRRAVLEILRDTKPEFPAR